MNKKEYVKNLKYYGVCLLFALPVILLLTALTWGNIKESTLWIITIVICLLDVLIAIIVKPKYEARKERIKQEKKKNKKGGDYDPYSD